MKAFSIGVDIVDVKRFKSVTKKQKVRFIENTFSALEQAYCFSYKDPSPHFAGTFAAKEAIQKATGLFHLPPPTIEIRRTKDGKPTVWIKGKSSRSILVTISHEKNIACAFALYQK